jgi:hypothetical protein
MKANCRLRLRPSTTDHGRLPTGQTILLHVQAQSIRHPGFDGAARNFILSMGGPEPSGDDVQAQRQRTYRETRDWMARARFAIVRQCHPAPRFLVNDKGYVPLGDKRSRY